jgi:E3 ubiquitin-protein ligase AMFR
LFGAKSAHLLLCLTSWGIQKTRERFLNFMVFKLMFIAILLEHHLGALFLWIVWFSIVVFFKLFSLLCRDRFDYLCSAHAPMVSTTHDGSSAGRLTLVFKGTSHFRPFALLVLIFVCNLGLGAFGWWGSADVSQALLLCFEVFITFVESVHTLAKYAILAIDARRYDGSWDDRGHYMYYVEFASDSIILVVTFAHYLHVLYTLGLSFTMIDVVLLLNMRTVVLTLRKRFMSFRFFVALERELREQFPSVEDPDQLRDEICPVCQEPLTSAKRLPCGHLYHLRCIRAWLEQNQVSFVALFSSALTHAPLSYHSTIAPCVGTIYESRRRCHLTFDGRAGILKWKGWDG